MSTSRFDLIDIVQTLRQRRRFILIVTCIAVVISALFYFAGKKQYTAKAEFFVANPLLSDRNSLFGGSDARMDYFANEDDIDRVVALAQSDTVAIEVVRRAGLDKSYNLDIDNAGERSKLKNKYLKNLEVKRTEFTMMRVTFTDEKADRAANVTNMLSDVLEESYRSFYNTRRNNIYASLQKNYNKQDSIIKVLTDTLASLRDKSGIYDLISPNRNNLVSSTISSKGDMVGRYVEEIQNIEAIKDGIVLDQTRVSTLLQQFSTGTGASEMALFHIISKARAPLDHSGPGLVIVILAGMVLGLFFSSIYILLVTYYKILIAAER